MGRWLIKIINLKILGFNFRMNEIEAAISIEQLKKLKKFLGKKFKTKLLSAGLSNLKGLKTPKISKDNTHVYILFHYKSTKI